MKRDSSSRKDGGIGRNPLLPHTTKMRITTNLKSINNQKCQKIKLHGTLTTKELRKKSSKNNQTGKAVDHSGGFRKTTTMWQPWGGTGCPAPQAVQEGLT